MLISTLCTKTIRFLKIIYVLTLMSRRATSLLIIDFWNKQIAVEYQTKYRDLEAYE